MSEICVSCGQDFRETDLCFRRGEANKKLLADNQTLIEERDALKVQADALVAGIKKGLEFLHSGDGTSTECTAAYWFDELLAKYPKASKGFR